jgi:MFS family permease
VVAEFSNRKWRSLCISMMVIGYPLGGTFGGMFASRLLANHDWRSVFYFGATATGILLPLVFLFVPESIHWLTRKQPARALDRVNASLSKLGHPTVAAMPEIQQTDQKKSIGDIFSTGLIPVTIVLTVAYFFHMTTFYFILKWTPKIVVDSMHFPPSAAGGILTWANLGGAIGGALFGVLTARFGLKPLSIVIIGLNAIAVAMFGRSPSDLGTLAWLAGIAGFFGNAGVSGLYSLIAYGFPTHVRGTGTGFVIGVGRGGAVLSPMLAGALLQSGASLPTVAMIMGIGSAVAAVTLFFLKVETGKPVESRDKAPKLGTVARARA